MISVIDSSRGVKEILRGLGIIPRGVQVQAIKDGVLNGESLIVCSPTGSGKTLIGEMALLRGILEGKRGLYLVPLRALAFQVANVLRERYTDQNISIGLSTGDYHQSGKELENFDIIVTTYERADSLLRHKASWLPEIGVVIIDEIQNLSDGRRGARLETLIVRLKRVIQDVQIVALSATIGHPEEIAEWLECRLVQYSERPVPLVSRVLIASERHKTVRELVMTTVQANGQVIVFSRTRRETEAEARRLAAEVGRQLTQFEKASLENNVESVEHWEIKPPLELKPLLHEGVAFHHAGLNAKTRRLLEQLYDEGLIKVLCATTTLAAGMDLPTRAVILTSISSPSDYTQMLPVNQVHQMLGRAGRPGRDKRGFGVILAGSRGEAESIKTRYFHETIDEVTGRPILIPRYEPIQSQLTLEITSQLLVALDFLKESTLEDIRQDLFGDTFLTFVGTRNKRAPLRILELGEVTAESALERHGLPETVRAARGGVIGAADIREVNDTVIGGMVSELKGSGVTCRFSARVADARGTVEGPMCSCGYAISTDGILCPHLIALGFAATRQNGAQADYVIPLSLGEVSPSRTLIRLGLVEGATEGRLKPTHLGRIVNRLYLRTDTFRELIAMLPLVEDNTQLLWLLKHLVSLESGKRLDNLFEQLIGTVVTTNTSLQNITRSFEIPTGDINALLENSCWLLYCISVIATHVNLEDIASRSQDLMFRIESRLGRKEEDTDD